MKKVALMALLITLISFSLAADAVMKFKDTTIDFGEVESGKVVDVKYEFENSGAGKLVIKNVSTSCGCTAAKLEKKEYQPGEAGSIPVSFNTRGYNGRVTKTITISTNDAETPYHRLKITGKIILKDFASIEMGPDRIDFENVDIGKTYSKNVSITNTGTIDLRLLEISHSPEVLPEFENKIIKPGKKSEVKVTFKPMQKGRFTTFLKIRSNAIRQRLIIVRINAQVGKDDADAFRQEAEKRAEAGRDTAKARPQ